MRTRIISIVLLISILLANLPIGELTAYAQEATISQIYINKVYNSLEDLGEFFITIVGQDVDLADVQILKSDGSLVRPQKSASSGKFVAQYSYKAADMGEMLFIDGIVYSLGEDFMPRITGRGGATDNIIDVGEDIVLTGDRIANLRNKDLNIKAYFSQANSIIEIKEEDIVDENGKAKIVKNLGTGLGVYSLIFRQQGSQNNIPVEIQHTYQSIVIVRGQLIVTGNITIFPNQGPVGTTVTITADTIESNVSVFLMKKGEDYQYTKQNMAPNESISHSVEGSRQKLTFKIPTTLSNGPYEIVLTNRIDPNGNINEQINKYRVLGNIVNGEFVKLEFLVVDGSSIVDLRRITPNTSSIQGTNAVLEGRNMGRISTNLYTGGKIEGELKDLDLPEATELVLKYTGGTYNGEKVKSIKRTITVQIGTLVKFTGYNLEGDVFDYLYIIVPPNDDLSKPVKDVIIFITDEIEFEDGRKETVTQTGSIVNGFTYKEIDYQPTIRTILPNIIQVDDNGRVVEDVIISISGQNFLKFGYIDSNGNLKIKNPEVSIRNYPASYDWFDNENIKIYASAGVELEDRVGEQLGNIIKIKIKKGSQVPQNYINIPLDLQVQNPLAVESDGDKGAIAYGEIKFVRVGEDKTPVITDVVPNIVTTAGYNGVKIYGDKFGVGVKVYLDGEEIKGVIRNGTGTELTFNAPPKPEGTYQIVVQNEEGGLATYNNFIYVKTYTEIKIIDFNPKSGSADTLVTVVGENFLRPNPLVTDIKGTGIYRLIGTRVMLGTKDVNEYYMENGEITLQPFVSLEDDKIIRIKDNSLELSDYYHSVILEEKLEDGRVKYYTIYFDTKSGDIKLTDGDKATYTIKRKGNSIIAEKESVEYAVTVNTNSLKVGEGVNEITLSFKTPYKVENYKITGNRVKVLNSGELIFWVPPMERQGYYDLTVINPDTKRDSKTGDNGFYYYYHPELKPVIEKIEPNEGSVDGGYYIYIKGDGFVYRSANYKSSVIIGTVVVNPLDVEISPDGKTIKVKVPKYPGDLAKETDMDRKAVAVVVVNPDGGSASVENGFAYIIPISQPRIDRLILNRGSAAGGESVIIEGSGFRFFEPFKDLNTNAKWDEDEPFTDLNGNGVWDDLRYWLSAENKEKYSELMEDYENLVLPILPKVYFGEAEVKIVEFTASTIEVITPKAKSGVVEVYLINNDFGVSNKVSFTYVATAPKIRSITPQTGKKQGHDKVEILGEGFYESTVKVIVDENTVREETLQLVQFGNLSDPNISNRDIPIDALQNSGRIRDKQSEVTIGSLTVKYDATGDVKKISFSLRENDIVYSLNNVNYDDSEVFLPINILKDSEGNPYNGYEYVRIALEKITGADNTYRLRVDRGYSPKASLVNSGHINVETPSYYTVGSVSVTVTNPDGGSASTTFQYKNPDSNPKITNILKDGEPGYQVEDGRTIVEVNYLGGNLIEIIGEDFRKPVTIRIGDSIVIPRQIVQYDPDESVSTRLIFTMPAVDSRFINTYNRVVVENEDGGFASSEPIYIKFIAPESTDLTITRVTPNFGPTEGGTVVTIEGKDFRAQMDGYPNKQLKVYFVRGTNQVLVPQENIISISFDKIVLRTPPFTAGPVDIKVENPDGNIAILPNGFTYVSSPKIISVVDSEDDRRLIENISVEGGQRIKIIGSDFMDGARVVFVPVLRLLADNEQAAGEIITIGSNRYVLEGGVEGIDVEVLNSQEILVTTPQGKLGDKGVIVINPDKGATNVYNLVYGIPEIGAPLDVTAEVIFDQYIRVSWTGVKDAFEYEIYVSEDGGAFEFIGSTELTSFIVTKIKPSTRYQFLVRAIGKYGTSKPIDESKSNIVTTGRNVGPKDQDGDIAENTKINRTGNTADITLGVNDFTTKGITIDLTRGALAGVQDITIRIPAYIIASISGDVKVIGKDYTMTFKPQIFLNSTMKDNKDNSNAGVVFKISTYKGSISTDQGYTVLGSIYSLEASTYVGKDTAKIDYLNGSLIFTLDHDVLKAQTRRINSIFLARYDESTRTWLPVSSLNRLGLYTVIGSRR